MGTTHPNCTRSCKSLGVSCSRANDFYLFRQKNWSSMYLHIDQLHDSWCRYLHETCQPPILHQNYKSANILLNNELEARVSDCGLATLFASSSQVFGIGFLFVLNVRSP